MSAARGWRLDPSRPCCSPHSRLYFDGFGKNLRLLEGIFSALSPSLVVRRCTSLGLPGRRSLWKLEPAGKPADPLQPCPFWWQLSLWDNFTVARGVWGRPPRTGKSGTAAEDCPLYDGRTGMCHYLGLRNSITVFSGRGRLPHQMTPLPLNRMY